MCIIRLYNYIIIGLAHWLASTDVGRGNMPQLSLL